MSGVSDDNYYKDTTHITNSMLGELEKSPEHLVRFMRGEREETVYFTFGEAYHLLVLEPDKFDERTVVYFDGRRYGKGFDEFKEENPNKLILSPGEYDRVHYMFDELISYPYAVELLDNSLAVEEIFTWEKFGVSCKCKIDFRLPRIVGDLKTGYRCDEEHFFGKAKEKYGYDRQGAFYLDGTGRKKFIFMMQEKKPPYEVNFYEFGTYDEFIRDGRYRYGKGLVNFIKHFRIGKYSREIPDN